MSGHSHYATIKRQKESKDAVKGNIFSKLARAITVAAKAGPDPDSNFKLRVEIDRARASNMPKENIERALRSAQDKQDLEEMEYEGFGPGGIAVIVNVATDNKNRTAQEIKNLFERVGGRLAGPGAVSFNFEPKGFMLLEKSSDPEHQMLQLIDLGVEDVEEKEDGIEVYTTPDKLGEIRKKLEEADFVIKETELYMRPKTLLTIADLDKASKAMNFLNLLEEHEDVQKVYTNLNISEDLVSQLKS